MVRFEENTFTITVNGSVEDWMTLHNSLCNIVRNVTQDNIIDDFYATIDFIEQMMPDVKTANKMLLDKK